MFRRLLPRRSLQGALILGCSALFLPVFLFLLVSRYHAGPPLYLLEHPYFLYDLDAEEPRNSDQTCVLPRVHPFHPSVWNYLAPAKPILCKRRRPELTFVDERGKVVFNESEVVDSGYTIGSTLNCYWSPVERAGVGEGSDDFVQYGAETAFGEDGFTLPPTIEIVRIKCRNFANVAVYDMLHAHVRNTTSGTTGSGTLKNPVNVLIFGLDSMSRLGFIRLLPRTYRYLTEELKMTVFRGMNKVGDNTFPNLVAMITGHKAYGGDLPNDSQGYDDWPLVWKEYEAKGYATLWAEDFPRYGLFNYLAKGFRNSPTLHYLRPFWLAVEDSPLLKVSSHMCYGSTPKHLLQMEYLRRFVSTYAGRRPFFGFSFLAELSHEYLSRVASADGQLEEFFRWMHQEGHLKNTLLMVMSDHGHRFDAIRTTAVGHIEERMPFFAMHVPDAIKTDQPFILSALQLNSGRLVTPFDTHATLQDLLAYASSGQPLGHTQALGRTLFGPIPGNRSCSDASIPAHYCTCELESEMLVSDPEAVSAAQVTVGHINGLLADGGRDIAGRCATLRYGQIRTAHKVQTLDEDSKDEKRVRVVVEAEPSKGIFEATVVVTGDGMQVLGDVSRINLYGDQPHCIRHQTLRKYCFCASSHVNSVIKT